MKKIAIILLLLASVLIYARSDERFFRFEFNNKTELDKISRIISISEIEDNYCYAYANSAELAEFRQMGYTIEFLTRPSERFLPQMAESFIEMRVWDEYPTYQTYVDMMYQFQTDHPDICQVYSIGQSVEGRELLVAKISDNLSMEEDEPEFFYTGQIHGDELVTFILLLRLIDHITENYTTDPEIANLVDNIEIYINPLSNPDGTYAQGNHTVWGSTRYNANGVDLNRNFPDPEDGPHPDGNDWQPETIIMMDFAEQHTFNLSANLHSGEEVVNYPWDTWEKLTADDAWWQTVSHAYADTVHQYAPAGYMNGFENGVTNGFAWYTISGGRQDYMNYFRNCREFTLELSEVKMLPEDQLNDHWQYNYRSLLNYMRECLYGFRGISESNCGGTVSAKIHLIDHDFDNSFVFSDPDVGDFHRMLYPGIYDLEISAWGYETIMISDVNVAEHQITDLGLQLLNQLPAYNISGTMVDAETNQPLPNVMIELLNTPLAPAYSDDNGNFTIEDVYEGNYEAKLFADGYCVSFEQIAVNEQSTQFEFTMDPAALEDFETGNFSSYNWTLSGDNDWQVTDNFSYHGDFSARSGLISHNQYTALQISLEVVEDGFISFYIKISSEAGYDFMRFFIDNQIQAEWSGELDWQQSILPVSAGQHTFKWLYFKDGNTSSGMDTAWLDCITFPPTELSVTKLVSLPGKNELLGNHPNPFNPSTTIEFNLADKNISEAKLDIYNTKGQLVKQFFIDEDQTSIEWNGTDQTNRNVASGIYFYRLNIDGKTIDNKKMLMLK